MCSTFTEASWATTSFTTSTHSIWNPRTGHSFRWTARCCSRVDAASCRQPCKTIICTCSAATATRTRAATRSTASSCPTSPSQHSRRTCTRSCRRSCCAISGSSAREAWRFMPTVPSLPLDRNTVVSSLNWRSKNKYGSSRNLQQPYVVNRFQNVDDKNDTEYRT